MKHTGEIKWIDKMALEAEVGGHKIILDADEKVGGEDKGFRPKPLILVALGGCTAMDVISILKKMRVTFTDFKVKVEGEMTEENPKKYKELKVIYEFEGEKLEPGKIKKAVKLSEERYCGVSAMLKESATITSEIRINGELS